MSNISHIDHIAIAVFSINEARRFYEEALGLVISHEEELKERGIRTAFITLGKTTIELIEPLREDSEISLFLKKRGPGIHHIALYTNNISTDEKEISKKAKVIYPVAQNGAHDMLINFIHPKSSDGVLIELVQKKA